MKTTGLAKLLFLRHTFAVFAACTVNAAVDVGWIKDGIRTETIFDRATFVAYDRTTGITYQPNGSWPRASFEFGSPPVTFAATIARFPSEAKAATMVELLRARVSTGGTEFPREPIVSDHDVFFGGYRLLGRRKDVVFELIREQETDLDAFRQAGRELVGMIDVVRAGLARGEPGEPALPVGTKLSAAPLPRPATQPTIPPPPQKQPPASKTAAVAHFPPSEVERKDSPWWFWPAIVAVCFAVGVWLVRRKMRDKS